MSRRVAPATVAVALALAALAAALGASGCGAVYHTGAIIGANSAFEEARLSGAEKWAPYEFYRAQEYLAKSREEAGYSDFEAAIHFAKISHEAAEAAMKKASMHKGSTVTPDAVVSH